jgi:ribA/ribD-fused uncharacterized protein
MIDKFDGTDYDFLSNFYLSIVEMDGVQYPSVEHAYQASKTFNPVEREAIRLAQTAGKSKRLGQKVTFRDDWEQVKVQVMRELLYKKFAIPDLARKLLATGDEGLLEGTTGWHDNFWGSCSCPKCILIPGLNHLGHLLMEVRAKLKG